MYREVTPERLSRKKLGSHGFATSVGVYFVGSCGYPVSLLPAESVDGTQQPLVPILGTSAFEEKADRANKQKSCKGHFNVGNTEVTKVGVVARGKLQRDDTREDKEDSRGKLSEVLSEAGVGGLPQY